MWLDAMLDPGPAFYTLPTGPQDTCYVPSSPRMYPSTFSSHTPRPLHWGPYGAHDGHVCWPPLGGAKLVHFGLCPNRIDLVFLCFEKALGFFVFMVASLNLQVAYKVSLQVHHIYSEWLAIQRLATWF